MNVIVKFYHKIEMKMIAVGCFALLAIILSVQIIVLYLLSLVIYKPFPGSDYGHVFVVVRGGVEVSSVDHISQPVEIEPKR